MADITNQLQFSSPPAQIRVYEVFGAGPWIPVLIYDILSLIHPFMHLAEHLLSWRYDPDTAQCKEKKPWSLPCEKEF